MRYEYHVICDVSTLGAVVAREFYKVDLPVVMFNSSDYVKLQSGHHIRINRDGAIDLASKN